MGIYPETRFEDLEGRRITMPTALDEFLMITSEPGLERRVRLYVNDREEVRTDCFCCSCVEGSNDAACRNHGFAAERPCDLHNMPGSPWDPEFNDGVEGEMPTPVHVERARRERLMFPQHFPEEAKTDGDR